jgi:hypothetical protein
VAATPQEKNMTDIANERLREEQFDLLDEAIGHLTAAAIQLAPSDDQIIADHVRDAVALLLKYRYKMKIHEAADEIERLREENKGLRTAFATYTAANGEELPKGSAGTTIVNDGRPT